MTEQIIGGCHQEIRIIVKLADAVIAVFAKHATEFFAFVVVIAMQTNLDAWCPSCTANRAAAFQQQFKAIAVNLVRRCRFGDRIGFGECAYF